MYNKEYYQKNKERIKISQRQYIQRIKALEQEKTDEFNSLSQDEQVFEMLKFVADERARIEARERGEKIWTIDTQDL